jgi:DNA-binding winged helix-turn-helix (wHTH) protein
MRYIFGDYVLDTQRYELHGAGGPIKLRRKVFQVFAYLLEHRDRVVPKQELLEQLWPGQFVGDEVVKSCMARVRKALGERGRTPRFVRTLHGQGYRFVAAVEVQEHHPVEDVPRAVPFSGGEGTTSQAEGPLPALSPPLTALGSPPWLTPNFCAKFRGSQTDQTALQGIPALVLRGDETSSVGASRCARLRPQLCQGLARAL